MTNVGSIGPPQQPNAQQPNMHEPAPPQVTATQPPASQAGVTGPAVLPNALQQKGSPVVTATQPPASQTGVTGPPQLPNALQQKGPPAVTATQPPASQTGVKGSPQLPGATQQAGAPATTVTPSTGSPGKKGHSRPTQTQHQAGHSGHASVPPQVGTTGAKGAAQQPNAQQSGAKVGSQVQKGPPDSAKDPGHSATGKAVSNPETTNSANPGNFPGLVSPMGDTAFPPTNLTFDHIQDPAARARAFENQQNLIQSEKTFGSEFKAIDFLKDHVGPLQRLDDEKLSIGSDRHSTLDRLKDRAEDKALDKGVEKAFETLVDGIAGKAADKIAPAVGPILDALRILQNFNDDNKYLTRTTPEAKEWQEKKTVGLICDRMAAAAVERAKAEHRPVPVEYRERERLMDNYYKMKGLIETQAKNTLRPTHPSIPSISGPRSN
jgi:hypothetical protein